MVQGEAAEILTENGAVTLSETLSDEAAEALRRFRALEYYDSHHFRYEG